MADMQELISELDSARKRITMLETSELELQRLQEKLKKSEEAYRAAFESTGTAMMLVEEDTTITMWNNRLEEVTGYTDEYAQKGQKWTAFVHPDDMGRLMNFHIKRRQDPSSVPGEYEFRLKHRSGEIRDILMNVGMIPGTKQSLISLNDITGRKRIERALGESERKYRDLFENANDIIYEHDFKGKLLSANTAALAVFGFSSEDLARKTIWDIIDPAHHAAAREHIAEKISGAGSEAGPYDLLARTKTGYPVWIEVSSRLVKSDAGVPVCIQGIARDITDRRNTEELLQASERRFRETAEALHVGIIEMDIDWKLHFVNPWGLRLFGYTADDLIEGLNARSVLPGDEQEHARRDIDNVLKGDRGGPQEYRLLRKDKTIFYALINSYPMLKEGRPWGIRACIIDISSLKEAQEQLKMSEERFRSMFSQSPIGMALCSSGGKLLDVNHSFRNIFGLRSENGLDEVGDIFTGLKDKCESVRRDSEARFEMEYNSGKGLRWLDWRLTLLKVAGKGESIVLAQVQDVTEQRNAEAVRLKKARDEAQKAQHMVESLRKELVQNARFHNMVSRSPAMRGVFEILPQIAQSMATVLISGASGTGKELIAHSLHELSSRASRPFVAINCSALPDTLLESELFGYKAGAFTDAKKDKSGKFAQAEGGSLLLDEIGDISSAMQVKLLRVLQEKIYEPLGATAPIKADVRVITATNKDLAAMVKKGEFREDLFYRIKVISIKLPTLVERRCDIPLLCDHFIGLFNMRYRKDVKGISDDALNVLLSHSFPGNIRELENSIEHAFIFCSGDTIEINHLPAELKAENENRELAKSVSGVHDFKDLEKVYIESILEATGGNKLEAAKKLGVHKATLFRKIRQLGIREYGGQKSEVGENRSSVIGGQ